LRTNVKQKDLAGVREQNELGNLLFGLLYDTCQQPSIKAIL